MEKSKMDETSSTYLGLNEHHEKDVVLRYMRFMRYQRSLRVRTVEGSFEDYVKLRKLSNGKHGNLYDEEEGVTFSKTDVEQMIEELKDIAKNEMETELLNAAHTNVLLLRQMCEQAERWHLKLNVNISELENKDLLHAVEKFEHDQFDFSQKNQRPQINVTTFKRLTPIDTLGEPADLLRAKIERLKMDNQRLKSTIQNAESQVIAIAKEKEKLLAEKSSIVVPEPEEPPKIDPKLLSENEKLSENLQNTQKDKEKLEGDLIDTNKKLLKIREQLEMAEKELEKKFSQTQAYANLKRMLEQKNQQIKSLRRQVDNSGETIKDSDGKIVLDDDD